MRLLVREPDAGKLPVRFDERGVETEQGWDIRAPATERAGQHARPYLNHRATPRLYFFSPILASEKTLTRSLTMPIKKQKFYEGAALHLLARAGGITSIRYEAPFFLLNDQMLVLLKYCTRGRNPWGFTFTTDEQLVLQGRAEQFRIVIGLVCGADGVAALVYDGYRSVATPTKSALHIACYRQHREHYEVNGPDGRLDAKVAPSDWLRILDR
jgi:hypothetical protein